MKNNVLKKIVVMMLALVFLMTAVTGCGSAANESSSKENSSDKAETSNELTKVNVGIDAQQLAYVQIVAKQKGFFEKNGIDVNLVNYAVGIDTINALVLGEVEIGAAYDFAGATRLAEKTNLRLTSSYVYNSKNSYWIETADPDIKEPKDLKGKTIALSKGTLFEYLWAKELEYAGLEKDDVEYLYLGSGGEVATAYVSGKADAVIGEAGFQSQYDTVEGRHSVNTIEDIGISSQGYIFADKDFAKEHNDALVAYYKGLDEAIEYIKSNKEDAAQIAADYLTLSKDDILTSLDMYEYEIRFLQEDYDHIQDIAVWNEENGITEKTNVSDYLVLDAVKEFAPDKVTYSGN